MRAALLLWMILLACGGGARAQVFDLSATRLPVSPVDTAWRYHPGDDPSWSQSVFDDSRWPVLHPRSNWRAQGYHEESGLAWFRFQLMPPAHTSQLVLLLPGISRSYQLFADGRMIGQVGQLPPARPTDASPAARVWTLPVSAEGRPVTVALRIWEAPAAEHIRASALSGRALAGEPKAVLREFTLIKAAALLARGNDYSTALVALIVGGAALVLAWATRQATYLWLAASVLLSALVLPIHLASQHWAWNLFHTIWTFAALDALASGAQIMLVVSLLGLRGIRAWALPLASLLVADGFTVVYTTVGGLPLTVVDGSYFVFAALFQGTLLWYLLRAWPRGTLDARLLLLACLPPSLLSFSGNLGHWLVDLGVPAGASILPTGVLLTSEPFTISLNDTGQMIFLLGLLAVLVYRFAYTSREEQRLASALQAAHDAQQRLVPVDLPHLVGLHAEVVGGDFCQVLPRADGTLVVAIGDVSGKGVEAAMLGTLAVGALQAIAGEMLAPAEILDRLNGVVLQAGHRGFITCLCIVLRPDGQALVANAGHLAPYLNGREVEVEPGLPLGIVAEAEYAESTFHLPGEARLTLISDGVVEARSKDGELFGFERTVGISGRAAREIAEEASRHGQQDDITVVTLDWRAPAVLVRG